MPAPALAAIPILVSFAEAAGIVVAGVATAAGIDTLSKKVEEYVEENPEQSQKILAMIMPAQGIANILKNESDDGEEVSETEEVAESESGSTKDMVLEELNKKTGNYSDPNATGNYASTRGRIIGRLKREGKIRQDNDPNYDPDKKYKGFTKFYKKKYANGGGVGSMMQRKSFRGGGSYQGGSGAPGSAESSSKSSTNQGPAGGQSTGGNYNGGSNNPIVNRIIANNKPEKSPFAKFADHDNFTDRLKESKIPNYHQLGGFDFMARFPGTNPNLAKGLASAYQNIFEYGRAVADGFGGVTFEDAGKKAAEESRLNAVGIDAFSDPNSKTYKTYSEGLIPEIMGNVRMANGGRVNYNQGSNWWDTLDSQGMGVYNSMKRGGHDDATIQSQLAMLGYYDPNSTPNSTTDVPNIINQNINQGGGEGGGGITATGPGLGYRGPGSTASGNFNIYDIAEGTIDDDDLSFGLSLKEGLFGLERLYNSIPTPLNLAKKAANKFKNYRADKKEKAAAKQSALDAINASMANDQRINNQQDWTGRSDNYSGGMDSNTGNYNDPYDSGYAD